MQTSWSCSQHRKLPLITTKKEVLNIFSQDYLINVHPPNVTVTNIYMCIDLYMFDAFQYSELSSTHKPDDSGSLSASSSSSSSASVPPADLKQARLRRRPVVESLYDVFFNIREDEAEHASTMRILQQDATLRSRGRT